MEVGFEIQDGWVLRPAFVVLSEPGFDARKKCVYFKPRLIVMVTTGVEAQKAEGISMPGHRPGYLGADPRGRVGKTVLKQDADLAIGQFRVTT